MYTKTDPLRQELDDSAVSNMADAFQRIGTDLISKQNIKLGLLWLRRGCSLLGHENRNLTPKAKHLYLGICNDIMQVTLRSNPGENIKEARSILDSAESALGNHPILLHWRLWCLQTGGSDAEAYAEAVNCMILSSELSESTLCLAMSHIVKLGADNSFSPSELLDDWLLQLAGSSKHITCISRIVFMRIWMVVNAEYHDIDCQKLYTIMEQIHQLIETPLPCAGVEACHAVGCSDIVPTGNAEVLSLFGGLSNHCSRKQDTMLWKLGVM
jgi:hypothetical protein